VHTIFLFYFLNEKAMQHVHTRHRTAMLGRRFFQDLHLPVSVTAPTPAPAEGYRDKVAAAAVAAAAAAAPALV